MRSAVRLVLTGLVLATVAGCGKGKVDKAGGDAAKAGKTMEDSVYIELQAQLNILAKQFGPRLESGSEAEEAAYRKAQAELLASFEVSKRDLEIHDRGLAEGGDMTRVQEVAMAISDRVMELELME